MVDKWLISAALIGHMSPPAYIECLSLILHVERLQYVHVGRQVMFLLHTPGHTLPVLSAGVLWC